MLTVDALTLRWLKHMGFVLLLFTLITFTLYKNTEWIIPSTLQSNTFGRFKNTNTAAAKYNLEDIKRIQEERQRHFQTACEELNRTQTIEASPLSMLKKFDRVFVFPKSKMMYCYVPKVGTTSWKRLLLAIHGYPKFFDANQSSKGRPHEFADRVFLKLSQMSIDTAKRALSEYKSFFFVRNPYTRLLSAFRDKIGVTPNSFHKRIQSRVKDWIRENEPDLAKRHPSNRISFEEFVTHYIKADTKNEHWEDMYEICHPCTLKYDFIGYFETFETDTSYLIDQMRSDMRFPDAVVSRMPTHSSDDNILMSYYSRLSDQQMENLSHSPGLTRDSKLFGFDMPECIRRDFSETKEKPSI